MPEIVSAAMSAAADGKYYHWDELRYRKPPFNLTHEEWWLALKIARSELTKRIRLKDIAGHSFRFGTPDPVPELLHRIDQNAAGRIEMAEPQITNPETRDRYIIRSLVEEAITSSQLEGAATTRLVAKEMIRSGRRPKDHSEQMILNNYWTMHRIRHLQDRELTAEMLLEIHQLVTNRTLENPAAEGRFRNSSESVDVSDSYNNILHRPPPAEQLPKRVKAMLDFANGRDTRFFVHPVIRSILLHFWLAYDHPFVDGNGRCARALFYWSMLRYGYWMFEFLSISSIIRAAPIKYGRTFLWVETDDNDLTYFILYHLDIIQRAIDEMNAYIERKMRSVREMHKLIRASAHFNSRQLALLSHALRHPDGEYTIKSHQNSHNVVPQTARTDLLDLLDRGLLHRTKIGRTWVFSPSQDLEQKLKKK